MPTTVWQTSPPANPALNNGADISFGTGTPVFTSTIMHNDFLDFGSVLKGVQRAAHFCMFEIQEPVGTVFDSISYSLDFRQTSGVLLPIPFWFGLCEKDGRFNVQTEGFPRGIGNYLTTNLFPLASGSVDPLWVSGSASIVDNFPTSIGARVSWGSVGSGSDFEDDKFLTDFQLAFDANESDRTVNRGIPIMLHLRPADITNKFWRFDAQNHATLANRPTLTLGTPVLDLGNIYDVVARPQQIDVTAKPQQADTTAKAQQIDVTAKAQQTDVAAKPQQTNVTAKPNQIDVVAGAEDGND